MKKDIAIALITAFIVAGLAFVLNTVRPDYAPTPSAPFSSTAKPSSASAPSKAEGHVVMRINGEPITEEEFTHFLEAAPEQARPLYASPQGHRLLAEELVKLKALEQEGRKLGVDRDGAVRTQIEMSTAQIIAANALQKIVGKANEQQLRAEYDKQRAQFETVDLSHILLAYQGSRVPASHGPALPLEQAMQRAQQIAAAARSGNFEAVAKAQSDDTESGQQGGHIGQVPIAQLPPELRGVVAKMKPGEVSAPVRSELGIHIFKTGARSGRQFEEMREQLDANLRRTTAEREIERIQKSAKVEYVDPKFFPAPKEAPAAPQPKPQG